MPTKKVASIKTMTYYCLYLVLFWGFYRLFFKLPDEFEELFLKPVVWLLPLVVIVGKEKMSLSSLGITFKNLFPSIYYSIGLGAFFVIEALVVHLLKYKGINFGANIGQMPILASFGLSFATAFSEEIAFRGYIFGKLLDYLKNEALANVISSILWVIIHIPYTVFVLKLDFSAAALSLFLTFLFGAGSAFIYARTKNIASSVFLHVLWQWPIILFR